MTNDYEDDDIVVEESEDTKSGLWPIVGKLLFNQTVLVLVFVMILYIIVSSDVFKETIMSEIDGALDYSSNYTQKGKILSGIAMVSGAYLGTMIVQAI